MGNKQESKQQERLILIRNVLVKGVLLFMVVNLTTALIPQGGRLGNLTLYNRIFPGRVRLPFGENPREAYNLSLYDLEVMFASHEIDGNSMNDNEYSIVIIGDSSIWGILQKPEETLAGRINLYQMESCDGRSVRAYNLGYPSMSVLKDLVILERALNYEPDLIIWPITLQSLPDNVQIESPLVANNPHLVKPLMSKLGLSFYDYQSDFVIPSFWDLTIVGRRRRIFDGVQLQLYGLMWAATGIDQTYPEKYSPAQRDFEPDDDKFMSWTPPNLPLEYLRIDIIDAAHFLADKTPILIVNEPILISEGKNNLIRYNLFYPRWAYDQYRLFVETSALTANWHYIDLWDVVPQEHFTNSPVHLSSKGSEIFTQRLLPTLETFYCP